MDGLFTSALLRYIGIGGGVGSAIVVSILLTLHYRIKNNATAVDELKKGHDTLSRDVRAQTVTLAKVEENVRGVASTQKDISRKIDRLLISHLKG